MAIKKSLDDLSKKKEDVEKRYNLLKEKFISDASKFEVDINYVLSNNTYYHDFLSWLLILDIYENTLANKILKLTLENVDDRCLKDLFGDFSMEKFQEFLLLHNAIKDINDYLSKCKKSEIELNKLGVYLFIEKQKVKILKKIKRKHNEN